MSEEKQGKEPLNVSLVVDYNGQLFRSGIMEVDDLTELEKLCNSATSGALLNLEVSNDNQTYFIPKHIAEKSIITITKHKRL